MKTIIHKHRLFEWLCSSAHAQQMSMRNSELPSKFCPIPQNNVIFYTGCFMSDNEPEVIIENSTNLAFSFAFYK